MLQADGVLDKECSVSLDKLHTYITKSTTEHIKQKTKVYDTTIKENCTEHFTYNSCTSFILLLLYHGGIHQN